MEGNYKRVGQVFLAYKHEGGGGEESKVSKTCLVWGCNVERCSCFYFSLGGGKGQGRIISGRMERQSGGVLCSVGRYRIGN